MTPTNQGSGAGVLQVLDDEIRALTNTREMMVVVPERLAAYNEHLARLTQARATVEAMGKALEEAATQAEADAAKLHNSVHGRALAEKAKRWRAALAAYRGQE